MNRLGREGTARLSCVEYLCGEEIYISRCCSWVKEVFDDARKKGGLFCYHL